MTNVLQRVPEPLAQRAQASVSAPGFVERSLAVFVVLYVTVGFPPEWFNPPVDGVTSESSLVAVAYIAVASPLLFFLIGNLHVAWSVLSRTRWLLALHALMLGSALWSADPALTIRRSVGLILTLAIAVHFVTRFSQRDIVQTFATALVLGVMVNLAFLAAFPTLSQTLEPRSGEMVITGVFPNKNGFGQMAFLAVFVCAVATRVDRRRRTIWFGAILLAGGLLLQSESRTALATAVAGVIVLMLYQVFRARQTLFGAVLLAGSGGLVGATVFVISNLEFVTEAADRDASLSGRVPLWETMIEQIPERPFLGTGWSGFWNGWFSPAHPVWIEHRWEPPGGHNQFLDFFLQLGVVGGIVGLLLFGRAIWRGVFVAQFVRGIYGLWPLGVVTIAAIYSITETLVSRGVFWLVTMIAFLVIDQERREVDERAKTLRTRLNLGRKAV